MRLVAPLFLLTLAACASSNRVRAPVGAGSMPVRRVPAEADADADADVDATSTEAASKQTGACGVQPDGSRTFRVLHLNDIYRIEGLADGRGGLARVRSLRRQLEADCPDGVLLTHAGDALFPSLLSREYDGAQMIDVLNVLDGDAEAVDPRMVFTFGNHEFDKSKLKHAPMLQQRIDEAQFTWLDTNITWKAGDDGPLIGGDNVVKDAMIDVAGVKVGVFGMTIDNKVPAYVQAIDTDTIGVARRHTASLRDRGADVVIAVTHLDAGDDAAILSTLGDDGPDAVLGGHDHVLQSATVAGRPLLKGDADALRVRTLELTVSPDGAVSWTADQAGVRLDPETMPPDPQVNARVQAHLTAFETAYCDGTLGCLSAPLTTAGIDLIAEETTIRRYETNLGDWVTDQMRQSFPDADVAVVNSGALRLNQDIRMGTPITRQIVEELFAYPAPMYQLEVSGKTLLEVLDQSVSDWTGMGHWLQVSGLVFRHDPDTEKVTGAWIATEDGFDPVEPDATYRLVTVNYLIDPSIGDQDGYTMLSKDMVQEVDANGTDLKDQVLKALEAAGDAGIAPVREGRICNAQEEGAPCLVEGADND